MCCHGCHVQATLDKHGVAAPGQGPDTLIKQEVTADTLSMLAVEARVNALEDGVQLQLAEAEQLKDALARADVDITATSAQSKELTNALADAQEFMAEQEARIEALAGAAKPIGLTRIPVHSGGSSNPLPWHQQVFTGTVCIQ